MSFVLDSSAALSWCFPEEQTPESIALLQRARGEQIYAPALWHIEVANILAIARRKGRINVESISGALELFNELPIEVESIEERASISHLLFLCDTFGLTAYDASYLNLAMRLQLPLATRDVKLAKEAHSAGIELLLPLN